MEDSNTLSSAMQNIITRHAPTIKLNQNQVSNILPQDQEEASDSEKVSQPQPPK